MALRAHHFSTLPETLVRSGAAAIVPRRVADMFALRWPLRARPLGDLVEGFEVRLFTNPALPPTAGRRWFFTTLADAVKSFASGEDGDTSAPDPPEDGTPSP